MSRPRDPRKVQAVVQAYEACGKNAYATARFLKMPPSTVDHILNHAKSIGFTSSTKVAEFAESGKSRIQESIQDGHIIVGSDAHYYPGEPSTAHRAFVQFCRELRPKIVVMNGDVFDGASISRHPRIGWEKSPSVKEELQAVTQRLTEIEEAAPNATKIWPLGNHDARFETFLAANAPQYEGTAGFSLKDHFSLWRACWALEINAEVMIKHRFKGGIHATHNNTLWAGKTVVTGHLHSLKVTPFTDYNGTRYGVDTGCLAALPGEQFENYLEANPVNWRSGFVVLTFYKGKLLMPELVKVFDEGMGLVEFRGTVGQV